MKMRMIHVGTGLLCGLLCGAAMADTYRFAGAEDSDWTNGRNWQNQTTGSNGWQVVGGIPLPGADDVVRFNYGNATGTLDTDAGIVDALQMGVDEGGTLIMNAGAVLATDSGNTSGMGLGGGVSDGYLTVDGGLLTINNSWTMGVNSPSPSTATLEINGGEMRVASGGFIQNYGPVAALTTINGGVLHVNELILGSGILDIAGGTLKVDGDVTGDVPAWQASGRMTANGGSLGSTLDATFAAGVTTIVASSVPVVTVPNVTGLAQATAEADITAAGLVVGDVTLASDLPGSPTPGTVYSQTPTGGTDVASGTSVSLIVVAPDLPPPETADLTPTTGNSEGSFITTSYGGRTVWQTTNPNSMLYFRVPATFDFVEGLPVYVRIEYHDSGRGKFFAEYDSNLGSTTPYKFWDSELHARSSRVGTGGFVYNYQMFESPLFARRQNGSNDFRFQLSGSDGTPLRIASVQISNRPFDDEKFQYALSRPWLQPYTGEVNDFVDPNTLVGKVMTGYQGWFGTPNDADDQGWRHWARSSGVDPSPTQITIDMWPWINEYRTDDLYPAGNMVHQDGRQAYLFSSRDPATVQRHFRWMRKHDIDGAYVQRFVSRGSSGYYGASEFVLNNVKEAANKEGRVWAIEYDVSSLTGEANPLEVITNDWNFLVNDCHILDDPRYVHEGGKPVLFIWGFSVPGREGLTLAEADAILDWFGTKNLYLIGGVHSTWESNTSWYNHYQKYDQLLAWMERTKSDLVSQKARLDGWGMKILPHAWPGFSWNNLQQTVFPQSYTARNGGQFYWNTLYNAVSIGADQIFLGMFDEYDEGTAIMPMSDNHPDIHTEWGHYLDNEGRDPFWYLQLSGAAREMLNGFRPLSASLPAESTVYSGAYGGDDATVHLGTVDAPDGLVRVPWADGSTVGDFLGGHDCRTLNAGNYFYFDIDDTLVYQNAAGQKATVEIEFYDAGAGATFQLQYDGLGGAYTHHTDVYTSQNSGTWRNVRWNVSDGYFGGSQNGLSDFRIVAGLGAAIRRVSVFFPEEQGGPGGDSPHLEYVDGSMYWPVLDDAVGWRLAESDHLPSNTWQEVSGPFSVAEGMIQYDIAPTNNAGFYKLQRPVRQ